MTVEKRAWADDRYGVYAVILKRYYGLEARAFAELKPGWSALAYRVDTDRGAVFLKVFDRGRHTVQTWIAGIDHYMPVVVWLNRNTALRGRMVTPLLTADGAYKCADSERLWDC